MVFRSILRLLTILLALLAVPAAGQGVGTLVSADSVSEVPTGMQAWRIVYRTTNQDGAPQQVTGMVIAPREAAPANRRRVIAWAHGLSGVAERCAPSLSPSFFKVIPALQEVIRRGYVVVAPDYPGLGSVGPHGSLVGRDTAQSVLDAVRASRAIPAAAAGSRFALWGESQGGHAALWTANEAARYAPDLTLVGTVAAAPPTDLVANLREGADPNARTMLTAYITYSWSQRFHVPLSKLYNRRIEGVVTRLARNNCVEMGKTPRLGTILGIATVRQALRNKDIGRIEPWAGIAKANSVVASRVPQPLLLLQGGKDTIVAPAVTRNFARNWCRTGRSLRYIDLPNADHPGAAREGSAATLDWIDARFAGERPPSDCGSL